MKDFSAPAPAPPPPPPPRSSGRRDEPSAPPPAEARHCAQFGLGKLMLFLTAVAAVGAPLGYLGRAVHGDRRANFIFILLCVAVPTLFLVLVSLLSGVLAWWVKVRRKP